jgi:hypothetical protein
MIYLFIRLHATDYARWKEIFDIHLAARQAGGATDAIQVMRNVDDLNEITVLIGWKNLESARLFVQSVSLTESMQKAGVVGVPEILFLITDYDRTLASN